jgi:hypothetical protein
LLLALRSWIHYLLGHPDTADVLGVCSCLGAGFCAQIPIAEIKVQAKIKLDFCVNFANFIFLSP